MVTATALATVAPLTTDPSSQSQSQSQSQGGTKECSSRT